MKHAAAMAQQPPAESSGTQDPSVQAAANEDIQPGGRPAEPDDSVGPLWVITIGMGAFFAIAALVMMID